MQEDDRSNDSPSDNDTAKSELTDGIYRSICEQGRSTIDRQIEALNDIDTKSSQILRLNVLIIGALLTLASVSVRSDQFAVDDFFNPYTIGGLASLIVSTGFAGLTYTASDTEPGIRASEITEILDKETPPDQYYEELSYGYAKWIRFNNKTNIRNTPLITITILLVVYGITLISVGVAEGVTDESLPQVIYTGGAVFLLFLTLVSGVFGQVWKRVEIADPVSAITQSLSLPATIILNVARYTILFLRISRITIVPFRLIYWLIKRSQKLLSSTHEEGDEPADGENEGDEEGAE
jgi:hypothetical protein